MSAPSHRLATSSSSAAPSPDTPPPTRLLDLPTDLLERVLARCDSPLDIARVAAVSLLFHASLALEGIRLWAQERGFELPALPEGESCAVRWLCYSALLRELTRQRGRRQAPPTASSSTARGGSRRAARRRPTIQGYSATARA